MNNSNKNLKLSKNNSIMFKLSDVLLRIHKSNLKIWKYQRSITCKNLLLKYDNIEKQIMVHYKDLENKIQIEISKEKEKVIDKERNLLLRHHQKLKQFKPGTNEYYAQKGSNADEYLKIHMSRNKTQALYQLEEKLNRLRENKDLSINRMNNCLYRDKRKIEKAYKPIYDMIHNRETRCNGKSIDIYYSGYQTLTNLSISEPSVSIKLTDGNVSFRRSSSNNENDQSFNMLIPS